MKLKERLMEIRKRAIKKGMRLVSENEMDKDELIKAVIEKGKIIASMTVCLGGEKTCKACEAREEFLELLNDLEAIS